jgi:CdiI N-terminal domain
MKVSIPVVNKKVKKRHVLGEIIIDDFSNRLVMGSCISITAKKPRKRWGVLSVEGEIKINDFKEGFDMPLDWWSIQDYERQWKHGLKRLFDHDTSCLIVAVNDPKCRKFIEWWPLYKIGNKIHIQNHIIIDDLYEEIKGLRF